MAVFFAELDDPSTEGQRLVRGLEPQEVWLSHEHEPWRPRATGMPETSTTPETTDD
jgi:N-acyl homoserine lactone hydrolase